VEVQSESKKQEVKSVTEERKYRKTAVRHRIKAFAKTRNPVQLEEYEKEGGDGHFNRNGQKRCGNGVGLRFKLGETPLEGG